MNGIDIRTSKPRGDWQGAAVAARPGHAFSKDLLPAIRLLAGLGVAGDDHCGAAVQHRSRVARAPPVPAIPVAGIVR